jgi:hypothetical protein
MIYPLSLEDSILYVIVSDSAADEKIDFRDKETGVDVKLNLPAERAALVLIGKKEKVVIGRY